MELPVPQMRRKPSLTPMIDVVFLLLVFFMLSSRFGADMHLPLRGGGGEAVPYFGPPRLVRVTDQAVLLNGVPIPPDDLADRLRDLMVKPDDAILIGAAPGTRLQAVVAVMATLSGAGLSNVVLLEH